MGLYWIDDNYSPLYIGYYWILQPQIIHQLGLNATMVPSLARLARSASRGLAQCDAGTADADPGVMVISKWGAPKCCFETDFASGLYDLICGAP